MSMDQKVVRMERVVRVFSSKVGNELTRWMCRCPRRASHQDSTAELAKHDTTYARSLLVLSKIGCVARISAGCWLVHWAECTGKSEFADGEAKCGSTCSSKAALLGGNLIRLSHKHQYHAV